MKPRQKKICSIMREMGRFMTTRQIAEMLNMNINGVAQSLGVLEVKGWVFYLSGKAGDRKWQLLQKAVDELDSFQ